MPSTILLASRDHLQLTPWIFTLRMAGYMTLDLSRVEAVPAIALCNLLTAVTSTRHSPQKNRPSLSAWCTTSRHART